MNIKKYISLAGLLFPLGLAAQVESQNIICDFETNKGYTKVGVYDTWENSPFRKGDLTGNAKVCNNPLTAVDSIIGFAPNASAKVLGAQRSRFGSNTFGVLVGLEKPIALSFNKKYIRVKVYTEVEGRFMLIGLGKRKDRPGQSNMTEQLWETSISKVGAGKWFDAVFPISGNPGAELHNLLIVPDLSSPHNRTSDFLFYVDDIDLSDEATPRFSSTYYAINYDESQKLSKTDRALNAISLQADGKTQTIEVGQAQTKNLYTKKLEKAFTAKAGQKVTPTFNYTGSWMSGYVYLDKMIDGRFDVKTKDEAEIVDAPDLVAYSFFKGKDSAGASQPNGNRINPPAFTIPADLKPGIYRLRYKVDWDNVNPGGNTSGSNSIVANRGAIVDTRLIIHGDEVTIKRGTRGTSGGLNGDVLTATGEALTEAKIPFGQPYTVSVKPAPGFKFSHFLIRHGNITAQDSLIYDTPQYVDVTVPGYHVKNNTYVIPAEYIDGDVEITPYFKSTTGAQTDEYALNFAKDLTITRTDRMLNKVSFATTKGGNSQVVLDNSGKNLVYRPMLTTEVSVVPGDQVTTTVDYKGNAMHGYLFVDLNSDGQFDVELAANGVPTQNSELLSYAFYNGKNSLGESKQGGNAGFNPPVFTFPANVPAGVYRARFKMDWANIDPAGQWSEGGQNQIDANGGYVVDFLLNVHPEKSKLDVRTTNGSIVGANNTGMAQTAAYGTALAILPVAAADGYTAKEIIVRHGHGLDGEQFILGNRQWKEDTLAITATSVPAAMMNGEVRLTANFTASEKAPYQLTFSDEFDQKDGKLDMTKWVYRNRQKPTWARFIAMTPEGRKLTSIVEDGKYVARCMPNPLDTEVMDGKKVDMISGAITTEGKYNFKYGKIEGRMVTGPHTGNFPAFWMMPVEGQGGWPACGEIDIWEQINAENKSYHTIHSKWGNTLGHANDPRKSHTQNNVPADQYHIYGLEWTENLLTWYVDGKKVFSYAKKEADANALANGQWPFDKEFYLILNQSVGDGSWAAKADVNHTYETRFDWVRVYQKNAPSTGVTEAVASALDFYVQPGKIRLVAPAQQWVRIVDLQGRTVFNREVQGNVDVALPQGVYVLNNQKVMVP